MRGTGFGNVVAGNIAALSAQLKNEKRMNSRSKMCWKCQKDKKPYGGYMRLAAGLHKFICKDCMGYRFTVIEKIGLRNLGVKFLGKDRQWHHGRYLFTVDFCADGMDADTGFTEQAEEHKSFNFIRLDNGQFASQPNNRCLWYDQSLIPAEVKFPDFQAAKDFYTVDGSRKWSAGDDWFYDIVERST